MQEINVTYFKTVFDSNNPVYTDIRTALMRIKNGGKEGRTKEICERIANAKTKDEKNEIKKELPAICFSGEFSSRSNKGLINQNGFAVLDYDNTDEQPEIVKKSLQGDPYVYSAFISPSGSGIKVICRIPIDPDNYKNYYFALLNHFSRKNEDESTSDISRVCYESYDPEIYINENAKVFNEKIDNLPEFRKMKKLRNPEYLYKQLVAWINKTNSFSEPGRNQYITTLCFALHRFGMPEELSLQYLSNDYTEPGFDFDEIYGIVEHIYRDYPDQFNTEHFESSSEFYDRLNNHNSNDKPRDFKAMVVDPVEMSETLHKFYKGEIELGGSTGIPKLDEYFRFKWNEFWFFVGNAGTGKTTAIEFVMTMFAKNLDLNGIIVMKENDYVETREAAVSFIVHGDYKINYESEYPKIIEAEQWFDKHFVLLKNDSVRNFEDDVEPFYNYMTNTVGKKIDFIILDPITGMGAPNRLKHLSGDPLHIDLSEYYRDWSVANCSIWAIAHSNAEKQRNDGYPVPQHARFGGGYTNTAHLAATFHRDIKGSRDSGGDYYRTEFRIFKQRSARMKGGSIMIDPSIDMFYIHSPYGFRFSVGGVDLGNPLLDEQPKDNMYVIQNEDLRDFTEDIFSKSQDESPF